MAENVGLIGRRARRSQQAEAAGEPGKRRKGLPPLLFVKPEETAPGCLPRPRWHCRQSASAAGKDEGVGEGKHLLQLCRTTAEGSKGGLRRPAAGRIENPAAKGFAVLQRAHQLTRTHPPAEDRRGGELLRFLENGDHRRLLRQAAFDLGATDPLSVHPAGTDGKEKPVVGRQLHQS